MFKVNVICVSGVVHAINASESGTYLLKINNNVLVKYSPVLQTFLQRLNTKIFVLNPDLSNICLQVPPWRLSRQEMDNLKYGSRRTLRVGY